jgi:uncharacterized protein (UPF0332 family)
MLRAPAVASPHTLRFQFDLAKQAIHEADHLHKAKYWASCITWSFQAVLHAAAGLLYAKGVRPQTEREVRIAFASAFVSGGRSTPRYDEMFRRVEKLRQTAEFDHDHEATEPEATEARDIAHAFWDEAQRLSQDVPSEPKQAPK